VTPAVPVRAPAGWARFLAGFGVLLVTLLGVAELDATGRWGLAILAAVLLVAVVVERVAYGTPPREAVPALGFGRPDPRALLVACAVGALVTSAFPVGAAVAGAAFSLRPGWGWLLVGLFAFHGLAEELVWRGFAYRRLREGRSFARAVLWSMPLVALAHVPVLVRSGPVVGAAALLVAAVTSVPLAHLHEMGRGTIWAPAVLHTAIDAFKLVEIPEAAAATFPLVLAATSTVVPLLVLVWRHARPDVEVLLGRTSIT
jgi:membrane protease YdiL (CAAX protease family)